MIKINLLPPHIYEKRVVRNLMLLFAFIIIATAVGGVTYKGKLNAATEEMKMQADEAEAKKAQIAKINQDADAELGKIAPITAKLKFFKDVADYNTKIPALYQDLAKFTYKGVLYRKVTPTNTGLTIDAYTPSLANLGRYLLNMYKADSIFTSVSISAIPGYPSAEGVSVVNGGGYGGEGGMTYPGMSSSASRYGGMEAVASGVSKTVKDKGFNFNVTCALKTPITPPAPPAGGAATNTGGGMAAAPAPAAPSPAPSSGPTPRSESGGEEGGGTGGRGGMGGEGGM